MRTAQVSGNTTDGDLAGEHSADVDTLVDVAQLEAPVHLLRDPDGRRIYGVLSEIQLDRGAAASQGRSWNAIWGYQFTLTESERS